MTNAELGNQFLGYDGRLVVVTGASSGIGQAVAATATALGAEVIAIDVHESQEFTQRHFVHADLGDSESVSRALAELPSEVDCLFNCAGINGRSGSPVEVMKVNYFGLRQLTDGLKPRMPRGSSVANVASVVGIGYPNNVTAITELLLIDDPTSGAQWCVDHPDLLKPGGGYHFSKECLLGYTMTRGLLWAGEGVRINALAPELTLTPFVRTEDLAVAPKPFGRHAEAQDQANAILLLNSEAAGFVTGQVIWTDGGIQAAAVFR